MSLQVAGDSNSNSTPFRLLGDRHRTYIYTGSHRSCLAIRLRDGADGITIHLEMHLKIHKTLKASAGEVGKWAVANENESIRMRK